MYTVYIHISYIYQPEAQIRTETSEGAAWSRCCGMSLPQAAPNLRENRLGLGEYGFTALRFEGVGF